ncbi:MAG: hypothetical protein LBD92_04420 [Oscillospiraceae bacterium]|jgi:hypothetical protein|nr:hypothetical protein [Oscillospiraceae bacterium]
MGKGISLDLKKVPFSRRSASFMFFEEDNSGGGVSDRERFRHNDAPLLYSGEDEAEKGYTPGLYVTVSSHGSTIRRKGLLSITPTRNGAPADYTYSASPSLLTIRSGDDAVEIIIGNGGSIRARGRGLGLRFFTKMEFMEGAAVLPDGTVCLEIVGIYFVGGNFYFRAIDGEIRLDAPYNNQTCRTDAATVDLIPSESGTFEAAIFAMNPSEYGVAEYKPFDECLGEIRSDFDDFRRLYGSGDTDLAELCEYLVWINYQDMDRESAAPNLKADMIFSGRIRDVLAKMFHQPLHTPAVRDPRAALDIMLGVFAHISGGMLPSETSRNRILYGAFPPAFGFAVLELLKNPGADTLPGERLKSLYDGMSAHYDWWKATRSFGENSFSYAMPRECGFDAASYALYDFPLETPDLYTWLALYAEALAALARAAGIGDAEIWTARAGALRDALISGLWDGERFVCRGALSGKTFRCESLLAYLPVILGERLPREIISKLATDLGDDAKFMSGRGFLSESRESVHFAGGVSGRGAVDLSLQHVFILGLRAAGCRETADRAAAAVISGIETFGARDVVVPDGAQPERVPADNGDSVAASAALAILGNRGKE